MSGRPSPRRPLLRAGILCGALLAPAGGLAQEPPAVPEPGDESEPLAGREKPRSLLQWKNLELHGRFLGRLLSEQQTDGRQSDLEAENARLELRFRPTRWLHAVVEYDQADGAELKDAYLALRPGPYEIRIGQFKPPVSPIELASRWDLPVSERGLLCDLLRYSFGIADHRPGLQLRGGRGRGLSATAGVFRASSVRGDRIGDEAFNNLAPDWGALKATGRIAWRGRNLSLGGSFDLRPAEPLPREGYQRFWTASGDLTWRTTRRRGPELWAEGFLGTSWQDANAFDGKPATFLAGRALVGWRFGSRKRTGLRAEPYALLTVFDPDTSVRDDLLWEALAGLHLAGFGHLRLVLEAQHRSIARNAPLSLGLLPIGETPPCSRNRLVLQIGAAF